MYAIQCWCLGDEREEIGKQTTMYRDKQKTYIILTLGKVTAIPFADEETSAQQSKATVPELEFKSGSVGTP